MGGCNSMLSIGKNIQKHRKLAHLSQEKLAELAGLNEKSIHFYETNKRHVPSQYLMPIAKALNIGVEKLFEDTESSKNDEKEPRKDLIALIDELETKCQQEMRRIIHDNFDKIRNELRDNLHIDLNEKK